MKLYQSKLSGHSHRARLFLSLAGVPHTLIDVDMKSGDHKRPEFLKLNAFGEVPVLEDEGVVVADSNAILVYVARKIGPNSWFPSDLAHEAEVQRWLSVAAGKIAYGLCAARLVALFKAPFDRDEVIARSHQTLQVLERTLSSRRWIAGTSAPTIADVAIYSYVERAPEGDVQLSAYPSVTAWLRRVEAQPGFIPFAPTIPSLAV